MKFIASGGVNAARRVAARSLGYGVLALSICASASAQSPSDFADAAARMQYAFFTRDTQALEDVLAKVASYQPAPTLQATRAYQLAYGHWRLAELYAVAAEQGRREAEGRAGKAARACVEHARDAIAKEPRNAEAYAVLAICDAGPRIGPRWLKLGFASCARKALHTATELGSRIPRVRLIEALCTQTKDEAQDLARWQTIAEQFAAGSPGHEGWPDWGQAEAWLELARRHAQRNDRIAARDAAERALVIAPDYVDAQELLRIVAAAGAQ